MKTITLHTTNYLKAHSSNEGISLTTLSEKIGKLLDQHDVTGRSNNFSGLPSLRLPALK